MTTAAPPAAAAPVPAAPAPGFEFKLNFIVKQAQTMDYKWTSLPREPGSQEARKPEGVGAGGASAHFVAVAQANCWRRLNTWPTSCSRQHVATKRAETERERENECERERESARGRGARNKL